MIKGDDMKNKQWISLVLITAAIVIAVAGYCCYRLIILEKDQSQQILDLQESISRLSVEVEELSAKDVEWLDDGYNYLAIGNSITLHSIKSFWWNEVGMAASDENHDYFHLVLKYLESKNDNVMGVPYNFSVWETQSHDRDETLEYLDRYLSPDLDLITVQLAENAFDLTTYQEDYVSLLEYIKVKAPNARILVMGDFWSCDNRDELKQNAVKEAQVEYVSLEGITDNEEYYCGLGTIVFDKYGNEHIVEHSGVADHPGDKGMQAIAERIIEVLK